MDIKYLVNNKDFFLALFSTHYPFNRNEINKYSDKITWGSCTYSFFDSDYTSIFHTSPGLIFNNNIEWDEDLYKSADLDCNHLAATWEGYYDLPLKKEKEMNEWVGAFMEAGMAHLEPSSEGSQKTIEALSKRVDEVTQFFERLYKNSTEEELHENIQIVSDDKFLTKSLIFNSSFYQTVTKRLLLKNNSFSVRSFFDIIS